jgi:hypothetical protein
MPIKHIQHQPLGRGHSDLGQSITKLGGHTTSTGTIGGGTALFFSHFSGRLERRAPAHE